MGWGRGGGGQKPKVLKESIYEALSCTYTNHGYLEKMFKTNFQISRQRSSSEQLNGAGAINSACPVHILKSAIISELSIPTKICLKILAVGLCVIDESRKYLK